MQTDTRTKTESLFKTLQAGIASLRTTEAWHRYLDAQARFHRYSFANCMLILMQKPDATAVAGYKTWQSLNRQVRRGEHGITILAPITLRVPAERTDEDGETTETEFITRFKPVHVFDISQTEGEPLPNPSLPLTGNHRGLLEALTHYATTNGLTVTYRDIGPADGSYNEDTHTITLSTDREPAHQALTLAHELAHFEIRQPPRLINNHHFEECIAESVAYIIAKVHGLEPAPASFGYIAKHDPNDKIITVIGKVVQTIAARILDALPA